MMERFEGGKSACCKMLALKIVVSFSLAGLDGMVRRNGRSASRDPRRRRVTVWAALSTCAMLFATGQLTALTPCPDYPGKSCQDAPLDACSLGESRSTGSLGPGDFCLRVIADTSS